jgi:dTDP-4-amino-4,6-dideoxygalactose transaminase
VSPARIDTSIPYAKPFLDAEDMKAVRDVLASGWLTTGKQASLLEDAFRQLVDSPACLAVSSCTAALHLALELLAVKDQPVVVPTLTFTATAAAVVMAGGVPILADVDPDTLTLSPTTIERALRQHPTYDAARVIMPMHYGGNPSKLREIMTWVREQPVHDVRVVDDAAHALPAYVDAMPVGSRHLGPDATCYSFYPTKPITTGEGGMLALRDPELLERARRLSLHGIDSDAYQRSRTGLYHYSVSEHGWKYNLPDVLAALGRTQLDKAESFWQRRTLLAEQYGKALQPLVDAGRLRLPVVDAFCQSSWHLYVVRFPRERWREGWDRDRAAVRLKELGVGTSMHYVPLHRHPFWAPYAIGQTFGDADVAYAEILSLPLWVGMTEGLVKRVADALQTVCKEGQR